MRTTRIFVHGSLACFTVTQTSKERFLCLGGALGDDSGEPLHIGAFVGVFLDLKSSRVFLVTQKVKDLFVVDLEVGAAHQELRFLVGFINKAEDVANGLGDDTSILLRHSFGSVRMAGAHHRVGLTATGLSISKHGTVVTLKN